MFKPRAWSIFQKATDIFVSEYYVPDDLIIEYSESGLVDPIGVCTIVWDKKLVFASELSMHRGFSVSRYNYSKDWVTELKDLHKVIKSKHKRAKKARFADLEE